MGTILDVKVCKKAKNDPYYVDIVEAGKTQPFLFDTKLTVRFLPINKYSVCCL